jgi:hypothetical protein
MGEIKPVQMDKYVYDIMKDENAKKDLRNSIERFLRDISKEYQVFFLEEGSKYQLVINDENVIVLNKTT